MWTLVLVLLSAAPEPAAGVEACALLPAAVVAEARADTITRTRDMDQFRSPFQVDRCFYEAADFHNSVSLEVVHGDDQAIGNFWAAQFLEFEADEVERTAPKRLEGMGEDAYWVDNGRFATLYVLFGGRYLALDLGGSASSRRLATARHLMSHALQSMAQESGTD